MLAFGRTQNRQGTLAPGNMNSLNDIAAEQAQEGEEEEWGREMRGWNGEDEVCLTTTLGLLLPDMTLIRILFLKFSVRIRCARSCPALASI